jgi:hypothetical protein
MKDNEAKRELDWRSAVPAALLLAGILLILASFLLPAGAVGRANWSPEQAKKYQSAAVKLHRLSHESLHPSPDADQQAARNELQQAEQDYRDMKSQLDAAITRPKYVGWGLRGLGILLLAAGGFGTVYVRAPTK